MTLTHFKREGEDSGFTLIELLVVIIIIGILAAIAIPVFLNQRKQGYDATVKSDLRNLAVAEDTFLHSGADRYGTIGEILANGDDVEVSKGVTLHVVRYDSLIGYCLSAVHSGSRRHLVLRQPGRGHPVPCRLPVPRHPNRDTRRLAQQSLATSSRKSGCRSAV